jgi:hypothetical protein
MVFQPLKEGLHDFSGFPAPEGTDGERREAGEWEDLQGRVLCEVGSHDGQARAVIDFLGKDIPAAMMEKVRL